MQEYRVYQYLNAPPVAIKIGFNWPSLFFTWIWALVKGCWPAFWLQAGTQLGFMLLYVIVSEATLGFLLIWLAHLGLGIWYSSFMNEWRGQSLKKRGYRRLQQLPAYSPQDAVARVWESAGGTAAPPFQGQALAR